MKITHSINRNMFNEYLPSKAALSLVLEKDRIIKSEDLTWEDQHPPRLAEICLRVIVANFTRRRILNELPCSDRNLLLEILPTNLPLPLVLECLSDGIYWQRMVNDRWKDRTNHVEDYGFNWKRMYMERHVQELVENFSPEGFDIDAVNEMCRLASDYVWKLDLRQLKMVQPPLEVDESEINLEPMCYDHIDLSPIITGLKNLTELHIQFGVRHIGSNYRKALFELSNEDCKNIGEGVTRAKNLKVLRIHQSALDDDRVIALVSSMMGNKTIKKLEFSNCLIGDDGAIAIAKYLRNRKNLEELNLCNNKIGESGMEALSYVLAVSDSSNIKNLNLRFNAFGIAGLRFLASALIRDKPQIETLNLSCCNLDEESGILLAEMLRRNDIISDLNLSSNHFGEKVGRAMDAAMEVNRTITFLDLRMTGIPNESMINISRNLHFNRIRARKGEKGVEREMQMMEMRMLDRRTGEEVPRDETERHKTPEAAPPETTAEDAEND